MARGRLHFAHDRCKACGLCIEFCPRQLLAFDLLSINVLGYHPVALQEPDGCTGCALCALMCPDLVIEVERE